MSRWIHITLVLLLIPAIAVLGACSDRDASGTTNGASSPLGATSPIEFHDIARRAGIDKITSCGNVDKRFILETAGSGVAVADYDTDGDLDIYVSTAQTTDAWLAGDRPQANALFRSEGDGTFVDVAEAAGVALRGWFAGSYFVDYDNDGDRDLFLTAWGPNHLLRNEGDGTFVDVSKASGLGASSYWSNGAAFGDLDGDGDLDLYVANYCYYDLADPPFGGNRINWKGVEVLMGPQGLNGEPDQLFRNNGDGTFTDISREAGIEDYTDPLFGFGVVMSDLDTDGDLDIYVANDSVSNYLWRNDGGLHFTEIGSFAGVAANEDSRDQAGMGADAADFDGDGLIDLIVTNFSHDFNTLYRNRGKMIFADATFESNLSDSYDKLVWGAKFLDVDNDGQVDLFTANGHVYPEVNRHPQLKTAFKQSNSLYWNRGGGRFENVSPSAGPGLAIVESSRGLAAADLDGDGDLDLLLTNMEAPLNLLLNDGGNRRSWISVELIGTTSNRDAVGARLTLEAGGVRQVREVNPYGSFLSQSDYRTHFGLGAAETVDRLTIDWPSGFSETLEGIAARSGVTITEGRGITATTAPRASWNTP
jgi:hypothetical protein